MLKSNKDTFNYTRLTHISKASLCEKSAKSAEPDQIPQSAASDQVLYCLLTEVFFKNSNKNENYHTTNLETKMD